MALLASNSKTSNNQQQPQNQILANSVAVAEKVATDKSINDANETPVVASKEVNDSEFENLRLKKELEDMRKKLESLETQKEKVVPTAAEVRQPESIQEYPIFAYDLLKAPGPFPEGVQSSQRELYLSDDQFKGM